jgi:hypothetical protein
MQESGVTAASDREGVRPWFLGFFHRWERVCFSLPRRIEECAPLGEGRAQVCLIDWKGRAPVDQGAPTGVWHWWELTDSAYSVQMV